MRSPSARERAVVARAAEAAAPLIEADRAAEVRADRRERARPCRRVAAQPRGAERDVVDRRSRRRAARARDRRARLRRAADVQLVDGDRRRSARSAVVTTVCARRIEQVAHHRHGDDHADAAAERAGRDLEEAAAIVGHRSATGIVAPSSARNDAARPRSARSVLLVALLVFLALMQSVVSGRASRRFLPIGSSHTSQMPNVPSSIFFSARSSFVRRLFSRPRRRNSNDWRYSLEARSISSGRSSASRVMSSVSVLPRALEHRLALLLEELLKLLQLLLGERFGWRCWSWSWLLIPRSKRRGG